MCQEENQEMFILPPLRDKPYLGRIKATKIIIIPHCVFRRIPATDSDPSRPPIPIHSGHPLGGE
jgi:hypothetical protein